MPKGVYIRSAEHLKKLSEMGQANRGKTLSDEHRQKLSAAMQGELNPFFGKTHTEELKAHWSIVHFKGAESYRARHLWVYKNKGRPAVCEECGRTESLSWANISGEYKLDVDDYRSLCMSCHMKHDKANPPTVQLKRRPRWPRKVAV